MARGDGGDAVFETNDDRRAFLSRLGEVCESRGWRIHTWVLMSNHFHLLLETPQANGVTGMKWLLGTFSQGWNRARWRRGYVFQGRYNLWKESFKDRLLKLLEKPVARAGGGSAAWGEGPVRDRGEKEAGRLLAEGARELGLPVDGSGLAKLRKSDPRKVRLAVLLRAHTTVSNEWIAEKLVMGHPGSVSRLVAHCRSDRKGAAEVKKLGMMLMHED
jgi:hypothetical protein